MAKLLDTNTDYTNSVRNWIEKLKIDVKLAKFKLFFNNLRPFLCTDNAV